MEVSKSRVRVKINEETKFKWLQEGKKKNGKTFLLQCVKIT